MQTGRFAPSPTGSLHLGSLVAALGSYLVARAAGGRWIVRMEDLDTSRVIPGKADEILRTLERYGLEWDGSVAFQSRRLELYEDALTRLLGDGWAYPCGCSRADVLRAASAPLPGGPEETEGPRYPGTCRAGLPPGKKSRAFRFRVPEGPLSFSDGIFGPIEEDTLHSSGDFVIRRADGPFAYQLAVVVDDADQGVTHVVRGADLLSSTGRQIWIQTALRLPRPAYTHLPLVLGPDGRKLGKRDGSLPIETLSPDRLLQTLRLALRILGQSPLEEGDLPEVLAFAIVSFRLDSVPTGPVRLAPSALPG